MDDEAIIAELIAIRGIGRWTAEMFLIFQLGRLDVWSEGDVGLRRAARLAYGLERALSDNEFGRLGEGWRPFRSVASWYLWRVLD